MRAVCEAMKAKCKVEVYPWRRALRLAGDGSVDGIYVVSKIPERERVFYLSPPIVESAFGEQQAREFNAALRQLMKSGRVREIAERHG